MNQPLPKNPNGLILPYNATTMKIIDHDTTHILADLKRAVPFVLGGMGFR